MDIAAPPSPELDMEFQNAFDDKVQEEEVRKLNELSRLANGNTGLQAQDALVQNMSLIAVGQRLISTLVDVMSDLVAGKPLVSVFTQSDRGLYIGLTLLLVALGLWLIDITS
ncbi:hypothetical protein CVIRNUC_003336 [Coccomyxa viridis]|uniref:Uncharacterized protein n=1 Tax=Coccomyxa viridis TaxID=1274662 RepID=A0AAV1HZZ1_9CHLO|nr:hypothetical protein CVIRNUC_003336 [Coccomyxa viridis]